MILWGWVQELKQSFRKDCTSNGPMARLVWFGLVYQLSQYNTRGAAPANTSFLQCAAHSNLIKMK
jgi:hypothetical protein